VLCRAEPSLEGLPLVLVANQQSPPHIKAASSEAVKAGIQAGIPISQARTLCPDLQQHPAEPRRTQHALDDLLALLNVFTDKLEIEPAPVLPRRMRGRPRLDTHLRMPQSRDDSLILYLDLGRTSAEQAFQIALGIHGVLYQQYPGFAPALGLSPSKFTARIASLSIDTHRVLLLGRGEAASFLGAFPVEMLPVDSETIRQLHLLGLHRMGQVASLPKDALLNRFGRMGKLMHKLVHGADRFPVRSYEPSLREEAARQFDHAVTNRQILGAVIGQLAGELMTRLARHRQVVREMDLVMEQAGGQTHYQGLIFREPIGSLKRVTQVGTELLDKISLSDGVMEISLRVTGAPPAAPRQLSLFERDPVPVELSQTVLKNLMARHGENGFLQVRAIHPDSHDIKERFALRQLTGPAGDKP
jgi:nucleotidyltransferase/DNA polymerase involved in DNA repair